MKAYIILCFVLVSGCAMEPEGDYRLKIVNNTAYQFFVDYNVEGIPQYPSVIDIDNCFDHPVKINDTVRILEYTSKPWPQFFKRSKNDKLNLFIYNLDSLKRYNSIDTLIKKKIYKKLEYSQQELERLEWIVVVDNKN